MFYAIMRIKDNKQKQSIRTISDKILKKSNIHKRFSSPLKNKNNSKITGIKVMTLEIGCNIPTTNSMFVSSDSSTKTG